MSTLRHIGIVTSDFQFTKKIFIELFEMELIIEHKTISGKYIDTLVGIDNVDLQIAIFRLTDNSRIELLNYNKTNEDSGAPDSSELGVSHLAMTVDSIEKIYTKGLKMGLDFKSKPLLSPDHSVKVVYAIVNNEILVELVEVLKSQAKYTGGN